MDDKRTPLEAEVQELPARREPDCPGDFYGTAAKPRLRRSYLGLWVCVGLAVMAICTFSVVGAARHLRLEKREDGLAFVMGGTEQTEAPENPVQDLEISGENRYVPEGGGLSAAVRLPTAAEGGESLSPSEVYASIEPSVVSVRAESYYGSVSCTGVVISADGCILSAADGMENAASITVRFSDGRELQARRLGSDRVSGVCLLKVEARDLPTAAFAPEAQVRVGQNVYCVCNPYGTQVPNVFCAGMVSASRSVELGGSEFQLLQAAFLPQGADCGSPILDGRGNVIGIVTPIGEKLVSGSDPGFAVSARDLERIVSALDGEKDGTRNWLGLELSEIPEDIRVFLGYPKGLWIESVGTDTAPYGVLYSYDVVTALDGVELSSLAVYEQLMAEHAPGDTVQLTIYRNHRWYTVNLPVISR